METKMITIPFDLERAKRIQAGEEPGKIVTRTGSNARIICWDKVDDEFPIVTLIKDDNIELISTYRTNGTFRYGDKELSGLMLQIPQYAQFKDGDVLSNIDGDFVFILNGNGRCKTSLYVCWYSDNKISFGGAASGDSIEKYRYATKKEKQQLIDALKKSPDPLAKQYLKRFFGIEEKHKFEPFDKVLVRDNDKKWCTDFFSHFDSEEKYQPFICVGGMTDECIPYNEQTKHLLGTTDNWEE